MAIKFSETVSNQLLFGTWNVPASTSAFTMMCYATVTTNAQTSYICGKASATSANNQTWLFSINTTNNFLALLKIGTTTTTLTASSGTFVLNTRYHLCMTYNGTIIRFYINGTERTTASRTGTVATNTNQVGVSGLPGTPTNREFGGIVEDWRIYTKVFTQKEIDQVVSSEGRDGLYDNLYSWYPMQGGYQGLAIPAGTTGTIKDWGSNKQDGYLPTGNVSPVWNDSSLNFVSSPVRFLKQ